jgi:phosphate transport system substrate-binding protein
MTTKLRHALMGAAFFTAFAVPPAYAADIAINESGSTLFFPLFQSWIDSYKSAAPGVAVTAAATGSTAGTQAAIAGSVRIGTSDAFLSDEVASQHPEILDIPLAISAQMINYNLPGLNGANIRIDGPALAAIYFGTITRWDDPAIKAMNPGKALPHQTIVPVRRADGSGDTLVFTQFLDFSTGSGSSPGFGTDGQMTSVGVKKATISWEDNPGFGTDIKWPGVGAEKTATGNAGLVQTLASTPYSIGYVGISYAGQIAQAGLGTAMIKNQDGQFVLPTPDSISAAAAQLDPRTPPYERISLVFAPGTDSYPLINYEYAVVSKSQPDAATAAAVRSLLLWGISDKGGNAPDQLTRVGFIPLPDFIRELSKAQIAQIK